MSCSYILCRKFKRSENPQGPHVRLLPVDFHLYPAMLAGEMLPVCSWKQTTQKFSVWELEDWTEEWWEFLEINFQVRK